MTGGAQARPAAEGVAPGRDPLGLVRRYRRVSDGRVAPRIRELLAPSPSDRRVDPRGVATAWGEHPECTATCFAGIESLPRGASDGAGDDGGEHASETTWDAMLVRAAAGLRASAGPTAVALSGGLDSALVIALLRAGGVDDLHLYTVASTFPGYDESAEAQATARHFGLPLTIVRAGAADFIDAVPACVAAAETALYNLHPVERYLLARAVARDGHRALVTGDGADQVFAGAPPAIFLPILSALFDAAGVALRSPFFDPPVVRRGLAHPADADKRILRGCARRLGAPPDLLDQPKRVRLTPALDLGRYLAPPERAALIAALAGALGRTPRLDTDRGRVQWATLGLLWEAF